MIWRRPAKPRSWPRGAAGLDHRFLPVALVLWLAVAGAALAGDDPGDAIIGDWLVESRDAVIRVQRQGDEYQGHIAWQLHDTFGPDDGPELNGKPSTDIHNPNPALRSRILDGLMLLWGLHYDAGGRKWHRGSIYDSEDGHTYKCTIWLKDPDHLKVRGYVGISLFGGSTLWTRIRELPPRSG